jgi:DNA primase
VPEAKPDIRPVLEHYGWDGRVSGYGEWQNTRCPFHGDRNPSARVNEEEGIFHCHVCDYSGDAWEIVKVHENVDFPRAKEIVKELTGFDLAGNSGGRNSGGPAGLGTKVVASRLPAWAQAKHAPRKLV